MGAQEVTAPAVVEAWANLVAMRPDHDPYLVRSARYWAEEMRAWQMLNKSAKTPDTNRQDLVM